MPTSRCPYHLRNWNILGVSVSALIINPESPIMCQCCMEERKFGGHCCLMYFNRDLNFLLLSPCVFCCSWLSLVGVWLCACLKAVKSDCLCMSLTKGLCSVFTGKESVTWRRNEGYFTKCFSSVLQGVKSLTPADPDNKQYYKHHCLWSNILYVMFNIDNGYSFYESNFILFAVSVNDFYDITQG
jgi:hypothetical protein